MTIYAGETIRLKVTAEKFDGTFLVDTDNPTATITVFDGSQTQIFEGALDWSAPEQAWVFDYTTVAGVQRIRCRFTDPLGHYDTWEYERMVVTDHPAVSP